MPMENMEYASRMWSLYVRLRHRITLETKGSLGLNALLWYCLFRLSSRSWGRADPPSRRSLLDETSSTCLFSPRTNVHGWMSIIRRFGRKYPHYSRATQGLKRGCTVSARHCNAGAQFVCPANSLPVYSLRGSCVARRNLVLFVGSGKQYIQRYMRPLLSIERS